MGDFAVAIFGKYTLPRRLGVVLCDRGRRGGHGLWNQPAWAPADWLCHWVSSFMALSLSFLPWQMRTEAVPSPWGGCENEVS